MNDLIILSALAQHIGLKISTVEKLVEFRDKLFPGKALRYWAVADMSQRSTKKRLYLFDITANTVEQFCVAHGSGSDPDNDGLATKFSDVSNSHMTALGICEGADLYVGVHGQSLRLKGLEASNANIESRAIVMHSAAYVGEDHAGRSWGCLAVSPLHINELIHALCGGSLINVCLGE